MVFSHRIVEPGRVFLGTGQMFRSSQGLSPTERGGLLGTGSI